MIQDLSIRLWRAEEIAKNSVSLIEFKKSQFLLEESRWYLGKELEELKDDKERLDLELRYEKNTNLILVIFVVLLIVISGVIWFIKI